VTETATAAGGPDPPVTAAPDTQTSSRQRGELAELLRHLESSPYLAIERRADGVTLRVRERVVGTLNLASHDLSVTVPSGMVRLLVDNHPQLVETKDGVVLRVIDPDSCTAAEALLRWRVDLERFAGQLRAASP
jgi:hypothetical protein